MDDNDTKMVIDKLNHLENKLNQLTQQFKAHRDKKDIHEKHEEGISIWNLTVVYADIWWAAIVHFQRKVKKTD